MSAGAPTPAVTRDAWEAYTPSPELPWDLGRVAHLHHRAGFAATWEELQRDLRDGPAASVDRLLMGKAVRTTPADFERVAGLLADTAVLNDDPVRLKAWWAYRMLAGPDPLGERLTLLWHNHFVTSNVKVNDLAAMRRQNELFREHSRAPFGVLLSAAVRDPALLVWLDAPANRPQHPNENLGRELMELFSVGLGPYREADVKEAARALTGWTVEDGDFREVPARHDPRPKTILGHTGPWRGNDLVRILLDHRATTLRLAARLCDLFIGEGAVGAGAVAALAEGLRGHQLDVGWAVGTVLRSRAFFAPANIHSRVRGPAELVVGSARALEMFDPPPSTVALADWVARLSQDLFYPPNVFGWPGGRAWLTAGALIGRANYASALVGGVGVGRAEPLDALGVARRHRPVRDLHDLVTFYGELLLGTSPSPDFRGRLRAALGRDTGLGPETARRAVALILTSPEAQLA
jgi:uncharacterized protein (DUF1800 family)